jgi:hypothetical protein
VSSEYETGSRVPRRAISTNVMSTLRPPLSQPMIDRTRARPPMGVLSCGCLYASMQKLPNQTCARHTEYVIQEEP